MSLWGGRFERAPDALFRRFGDSLRFDRALGEADLTASAAWARELGHAGVLSAGDAERLATEIERLRADVASGAVVIPDEGAEDVHSWAEEVLTERLGDLARRLHTGRSRNDQVATDLRLWLRDALDERRVEIGRVRDALLRLAGREGDAIFPGYTHLQRAQPILFGHWCLAWDEALARDAARLSDARRRASACPLGSGALAGSAWPIDRERLAGSLGFETATRNSLDAVSARDFVLEALSAMAICGTTLSRIAEDLVFYASGEAGFIELGDEVTSGSSLMPQKKNPDALELIRGRAGRLVGALMTVLVVVKGLPSAYNKDLQEDKEPLFDAMAHGGMALRMLAIVLDSVLLRRDAARAAAQGGHANATDLADYLVERGVPFRTAHELAGRAVRLALSRGVSLEALPLDDLRSISALIDADVLPRLTPEAVVSRRDVQGGTAPARVRAALEAARARLDAECAARGAGTT